MKNYITSILFFLLFITTVNSYGTCSITGATSVCPNDIETYTTSTSGISYDWTLTSGGIITSVGNSATVQWSTSGTGIVILNVTISPGVVSTCSLSVTINPNPDPVLTTSFTSDCTIFEKRDDGPIVPELDSDSCWHVCEYSIVNYSVPYNSGSTYAWNLTGETSWSYTSSNHNEISVTWSHAGPASVSVTETNQYGCTTTVTHCVKIIGEPNGTINTAPDYTLVGSDMFLYICYQETANFFGSYTPGPGLSPVMNWFWDFGDGNFSIDQNCSHSYDSPGTYMVTLTVTNQCGCSESTSMYVVVSEALPPNIECPSPVCEGDTETYYTNANCDNYDWSISGGTILSPLPYGSSVQVVWNSICSTPGIISLETPDCPDLCSDPVSEVIPILCSSGTIDGPTTVCVNQQVRYSVPNIPGTAYTWTVPSGTILFGQGMNEIEVQWSASATSHITVSYFNPLLNCGGSADITVTIKPDYIISSNPMEICNDGSSGFTFSTSPSGTFTWKIYNSSNTLLHTYSSISGSLAVIPWTYGVGTFGVTAVNSAYCQNQRVYVTVYPLPAAPAAPTGDLYVCPSTSHEYSAPAPATPGNYFAWTVTNGTPTTANGNMITVTWGSSGPYSLSLVEIDENNCSSPPTNLTINLKSSVTPTLATYVNPQCVNSIVTYTISNFSTLQADDIQWEVSPAIYGSVIYTSPDQSQAHIQWNNDPHTNVAIILHVKTCGTLNSYTNYITLNATPAITINISDNPICELALDNFSVSGLSGGSYTYAWTFGDGGTSSSSTPTHGYDLSSSYNSGHTNTFPVNVTVTNNTSGCSSIATENVRVVPGPGADITVTSTGTCPSSTLTAIQQGSNISYLWYPTSETTQSISISATGTYSVTVTDASTGCTSSASDIIDCPTICTPIPGVTVSFSSSNTGCASYSFTGNITGTYNSFVWTFGDGTTSTSISPSHTYTAAGNYTVCLIATGSNPSYCTGYCQTISVPIYADFSVNINCKSSGTCTDCYDVTFYDKSTTTTSTGITLWQWYEGGLLTSTTSLPAPTIQLSAGTHNIQLIVSDGTYTCSRIITIDIPTPPDPAFTVTPGPYCEKITKVEFTYSGTGATNVSSALWDFGDNAYSSLFPTVGPQTKRVYNGAFLNPTPSLTVIDNYGCSYSYTGSTLTINPNDILYTYVTSPSASVCPGSPVTISLNNTGAGVPDNWLWSNGATSSSISVYQTGTYYVTASESSTGCSFKVLAGANISIKNVPVPVISGDLKYCEGEDINLSGMQGSGYTYSWDVTFNGSSFSTSSGTTLSIVSAAAGTYGVTLTISSGGCTRSTTATVTVNSPPPTPIITSSVSPQCEDQQNQLTATNAGSYYVNWSTGDNGPTIYAYHFGDYRATFTDANGCTSSAEFTVFQRPDFSFLYTGCLYFCDTAHITIPGDPNNSYASWSWVVNHYGTITTTSGSGTVDDLVLGTLSAGYYEITLVLETADGCTETSDAIKLTVSECTCRYFEPAPIVKFYCLFTDANGIRHYGVDITISDHLYSDCPGESTNLIITSPDGAFTIINNYPSNPIHGIYVPFSSSTTDVCLLFELTNSDAEYAGCNCTHLWCGTLPDNDCPYEKDCNFGATLTAQCSGNGYWSYAFTLTLYSTSNYTIWFSTTNGTLSGLPTTIGSGTDILTGILSYTPGSGVFCIQINAYDSTTNSFCQETICLGYSFSICMPEKLANNHFTELPGSTGIKLIPNPASDNLEIQYGLSSETGIITILNINGKLYKTISLSSYNGSENISTIDLAPGVYFVRLTGSNGECVEKKLVIIK